MKPTRQIVAVTALAFIAARSLVVPQIFTPGDLGRMTGAINVALRSTVALWLGEFTRKP